MGVYGCLWVPRAGIPVEKWANICSVEPNEWKTKSTAIMGGYWLLLVCALPVQAMVALFVCVVPIMGILVCYSHRKNNFSAQVDCCGAERSQLRQSLCHSSWPESVLSLWLSVRTKGPFVRWLSGLSVRLVVSNKGLAIAWQQLCRSGEGGRQWSTSLVSEPRVKAQNASELNFLAPVLAADQWLWKWRVVCPVSGGVGDQRFGCSDGRLYADRGVGTAERREQSTTEWPVVWTKSE